MGIAMPSCGRRPYREPPFYVMRDMLSVGGEERCCSWRPDNAQCMLEDVDPVHAVS